MATPAHGKRSQARRHRRQVALGVVALVVLVAVGVTFVATRSHAGPASAAPAGPQAIEPLQVVGTTPASGASNVAPSTTLTVAFSVPLAPDSPKPTLSPPVAGAWSALSPDELQFVAAGPLVPGSQETLTVPGGASGIVGSHGQHLATTTTVGFSVAPGSELRLQQLLAELGYLPLTFTPVTQPTSPQQTADPQQGTFAWRWANQPASLTSLWSEGTGNVITRGAVMSFESQHGLASDGVAGPQVWGALLAAAATGATDPQPYGYVYVSQNQPESVTVYQNGAVAYGTPANTGVAAAPTASGTFPVYERFTVTTMSGTNPDGSHYVDPGIPWVSYFNGGDALHGFVRPGYGYPQSDGCVEMPPANAAVVYPMTPIGTLVTVS